MKDREMKRIILPLVIFFFMACSPSVNKSEDSSYYRNQEDSIHVLRIDSNMIPMYSVEGKVQRMSISEMMKQDSIPGLSMCFIDNGQIAWKKHYGYANFEDSTPISSETIFTGASLSKPLTAIAALRMVEQGILELNEDVNVYLKEWKIPETELTQNEKVTLRRLLGHSAGVRNDLWSSYLPNEDIPTLNQMLAGESPSVDPPTSVVNEPGSTVEYSNPGYSIIQKILMDVRNEEFHQLMESLVLKPCDMNNSSFQQPIPNEFMNRKATGYARDLTPYPYRIFPYQAAGGIWTTPDDMAKFMKSLMQDYHNETNQLLSKLMIDSIFQKFKPRFVFPLWDWGNDIVFHHYGSNQGFNCFMYGSLDKNQGIVVMTNSDNTFGLFDYIQRAINLEYDWEYVKPEIWEPGPIDISWIDPFKGIYEWRDEHIIIYEQDQELKADINKESYRLIQIEDRSFVLSEIPLKISFPVSADDPIIIWESDGYPYRSSKSEVEIRK